MVRNFLGKKDGWNDEYDGALSVLPNVETVRIESGPNRRWINDNRVSAALRAWCGNDTAEVFFEDIYDGVCWDYDWDEILGGTL